MSTMAIFMLVAMIWFSMTRSAWASESSSIAESGSGSYNNVSVDNDTITGVAFSNKLQWDVVPYVVGLSRGVATPNYCVGVLVAPKFVLTSNKCKPSIQTPGYTTQYAAIGTLYEESTEDGERISITKWHSHPSYIANASWYDFMLVELKDASNYEPAFIAKHDHKFLATGTTADVYGWDENGITYSIAQARMLFKVEMRILDTLKCANAANLGGTEFCALGVKGTVLDSDTMDPCRVNLGSPMIVMYNMYITVVGIVTTRAGCRQTGVATGFSHVELAYKWIKQIAKVESEV